MSLSLGGVLISAVLVVAACGQARPLTREEARVLLDQQQVPVTDAQLIAQVTAAAVSPASELSAATVETVKLLMAAGISADAVDVGSGKPALVIAAESGRVDLVKMLLEAGAAVDASAVRAVEPFDFLMTVHKDVTCAARNEKYTALQFAAVTGHADVTRVLLDAGADSGVTDHWGHTVLHAVARGRRPQGVVIAKSLLSAGVDVNEPNCNGTTPLMTAAMRGNVEMVRLLLTAGADCSRTSIYGTTALEAARNTTRYGPASDYEAVFATLGAAMCQ